MEADFNTNVTKNAQNQGFTDTGCGIFQENDGKSTANSRVYAKNSTNNEISAQNKVKSQDFNENQQISAQSKAKSTVSTDENRVFQHKTMSNTENQAIDKDLSAEITKNQDKPAEFDREKEIFSPESISSFKAEFPLVDIEALRKSESFQNFLSVMTVPPNLSAVYKHFNSLIAKIEESANKKLLQRLANNMAGVGSLASSSPVEDAYFTKEQVRGMTPEQIKRNYQKIRESQAKW